MIIKFDNDGHFKEMIKSIHNVISSKVEKNRGKTTQNDGKRRELKRLETTSNGGKRRLVKTQ